MLRTVYAMPKYKAPLRKADSPQGWKDYLALKKCREEAERGIKRDWRTPIVTVARMRFQRQTRKTSTASIIVVISMVPVTAMP